VGGDRDAAAYQGMRPPPFRDDMVSDIASMRRTIELGCSAAAAAKLDNNHLTLHLASSTAVSGKKPECSLVLSAHPEAQLALADAVTPAIGGRFHRISDMSGL